jgi:hypothetical protein
MRRRERERKKGIEKEIMDKRKIASRTADDLAQTRQERRRRRVVGGGRGTSTVIC